MQRCDLKDRNVETALMVVLQAYVSMEIMLQNLIEKVDLSEISLSDLREGEPALAHECRKYADELALEMIKGEV